MPKDEVYETAEIESEIDDELEDINKLARENARKFQSGQQKKNQKVKILTKENWSKRTVIRRKFDAKNEQKWLNKQNQSIREKIQKAEKVDNNIEEFEIPCSTQQMTLKKDTVVLIPNHSLYDKIEARLIEESDSGSDPDLDELEYMTIEGEKDDFYSELKLEMLRSKVDCDGRFLNYEKVLFETQEKAGLFTPFRDQGGYLAEFECRVLFDYHSGHSMTDLDLAGGQSVYVCAEEYETFLLGKADDSELRKSGMPTGFLRGEKYSLVRSKDAYLTSSLGLVPSSYLVEEHFYSNYRHEVFDEPNWYLGICSFDQAIEYLVEDTSLLIPGRFVIFSPRWLNLNPEEERPFILLMLAERSKENSSILYEKTNTVLKEFEERLPALKRHAMWRDLELLREMRGKELDQVGGDEEDPQIWKRKKKVERKVIGNATCVETKVAPTAATMAIPTNVLTQARKKQGKTTVGATTVVMQDDRARWQAATVMKAGKKLAQRRLAKRNKKRQKLIEKTHWKFAAEIKDFMVWKRQKELLGEKRKRIWTRKFFINLKNKKGNEEPELKQMAAFAALSCTLVRYTIKRSYLGDFELFDERYPTLFHLVIHLSHMESQLPHPLLISLPCKPPPFSVVPMEPPLRRRQREKTAIPMRMEQWAAKHYTTVTEPFYQNSLVQYVVRSLYDPAKMFWKKLIGKKAVNAELTKGNLKNNIELIEKKEAPPDEHSLRIDPRIVIDTKKFVSEMREIGSGNFGSVFKTKLKADNEGEKDRDVVVKKVCISATNQDRMLAFVQEIEAASAVRHINIARFYGVITAVDELEENIEGVDPYKQAEPGAKGTKGVAIMVFELCKGMSLDQFLRVDVESQEKKSSGSEVDKHSVNQLIDFLSQIARALAYLHTRSPPIVHADLALRNVIITQHHLDNGRFKFVDTATIKFRYLLKLIDFGLAKFCRSDMTTPYDNQTMPIRWLPQETLKNGSLCTTTDVWSFGCLIWELFGGLPWGFNEIPLQAGIGTPGQYIPRQEQCPDFLTNLIMLCHRPLPHDRITMVEAEKYLMRHWIENEGSYLAEAFKLS